MDEQAVPEVYLMYGIIDMVGRSAYGRFGL